MQKLAAGCQVLKENWFGFAMTAMTQEGLISDQTSTFPGIAEDVLFFLLVNPPNMGNRHGNMLYLLMALWTAKSIDYSIWYPYDMIIYYPIVRPIFVEVTSPHGPSTLDTFSRVNRVHTADTAFWISFPLPCNGIRTRLKFRSLGHCSWWYSSFSRNKLEGERTEMVIWPSKDGSLLDWTNRKHNIT